MTWTDERVDLLRKLWSDGLSPSQIAAELGDISRNAVIGKVHRLGLSRRADSSSSTKSPETRLTLYIKRPSIRYEWHKPPRLAELCLTLLLSEEKADAIHGDLSERFQRDVSRYGLRRARLLYCKRTVASLWPLLRRAASRMIADGWRRLSGHG